MKRGSFFFRLEFCLKAAQKERRRQKVFFFSSKGRQKIHTIRQKKVFEIRRLRKSCLHHGRKHVKINDVVAGSWLPKLEQQHSFNFLFFFFYAGERHQGFSNYSITSTSSIRLLEYRVSVKGFKHSTARSITYHGCRVLFCFEEITSLEDASFQFEKLVSLLVSTKVWWIITISLSFPPFRGATLAKESYRITYTRIPHLLDIIWEKQVHLWVTSTNRTTKPVENISKYIWYYL